jgi:6,7-dimethyl-8-ribityllumazine synthase
MNIPVIEGNAIPDDIQIGIVTTSWNSFITDELLQGALQLLQNRGIQQEQVTVVRCPGAFEIPFTSRALLPKVNGIIPLGAVIRGQTPHFDYICKAVTDGLLQLNMSQDKPVVFGILTTDTVQQAVERADETSDFGNKGAEAALALLKMIFLKRSLQKMESCKT